MHTVLLVLGFAICANAAAASGAVRPADLLDWNAQQVVLASDRTIDTDAVDQAAWEYTQELNTPGAYEAYLDEFPEGKFRALAQTRLTGVSPDTAPEQTLPQAGITEVEPDRPAPTLTLVTPLVETCEICPRVVRVPGGDMLLGSDRGGAEGPRTPQTIAPFLLSATEITVGDMRRFEATTGYQTGRSCYVWTETGKLRSRDGAYWGAPGFDVTDAHPAACVSWEDAQAFVAWLNTEDARGGWRLPSESEFEFAARAGTQTEYPWPGGAEALCSRANGAGAESRFRHRNAACDDGTEPPVPGGTFPINPFGLSHMIGNLWEWTADCWNGSHRGALTDGSARTEGTCSSRVLRGGSWDDPPENLRSTYRVGIPKSRRQANVGFRVARDLALPD